MPYIGNNLATQFQAFATQTITGDGSTSYTLDRAVANGKELLVYINNVKQEEGSSKSYEASGTTITFSEAVTSGDSCYVVFLGSAIQTVTAPAGSIVSSQFSSADLVLPKTVTIGSAGAEDTKLVFDGNAQDFHMGLDDSADSLTIGLGSTLGTTSHMVIDANGHITQPLQPAFLATVSSTDVNNLTVGSGIDIVMDSEIFDNNADYNPSNGIFTAPVTGRYALYFNTRTQAIPTNNVWWLFQFTTSNRDIGQLISQDFSAELTYFGQNIAMIFDMDANDTAKIQYTQNSGTQQVDLNSGSTFFGGYLVA